MITSLQKRTLLAASLGWMLDGMDIMLYAMVLVAIQKEMGMSAATSGLLMSVTLVAASVGGILFGILSDRIGRARALMASIIVYSVFSGASGLAQNVVQLAVFRMLLGLGMGGEWATGAALVAETWPDKHRGTALGLMQSSFAIGYALAAAVTALVMPRFGWRAVFFVGVLPALVTLWIRRSVPEPEIWRQQRQHTAEGHTAGPGLLATLFSPALRRRTLVITSMQAATLFGWWGLFTWIPAYLAGRGLTIVQSSGFIILMQAGMWLGYVTFGVVSDRAGRKATYVTYLVVAAALVPFYGMASHPTYLLLLGPFVAFFGTGYFSGLGAIAAELFPTSVRGTAMGFVYNLGRASSALAPYTYGRLSQSYGLGATFLITSAAFLLAAVIALALEETRGKPLPQG